MPAKRASRIHRPSHFPALLLLVVGVALAPACATTERAHTLAERTLAGYGPTDALALVLTSAEAAELELVAAQEPTETRRGQLVLVERYGRGALVVTLETLETGMTLQIRPARMGADGLPLEGSTSAAGSRCLPCAEAEAALAADVRDRDRARLDTRQATRRLLRELDTAVHGG